jgi:hypothetical protein
MGVPSDAKWDAKTSEENVAFSYFEFLFWNIVKDDRAIDLFQWDFLITFDRRWFQFGIDSLNVLLPDL